MKKVKVMEPSIAFCGLDCSDCQRTKGEIARLSKELREALVENQFDKTAAVLARFMKPYANYDQCLELLGEMSGLLCKKGCRNGGGNPRCPIRACCKTNGYNGCWECGTFETCTKLDFLKPVYGSKLISDLKIRESQVKPTGK